MRTRIKICGITRWEDAESAIFYGVDALGFVFVPTSPRYVTAMQAQAIIRRLPPFVSAVGLFMDQKPGDISDVLKEVELDLLQFHGGESAQECETFGLHYLKAVPMGDQIVPGQYMSEHPNARGFLFDSHSQGGSGGSGHTFDWGMTPMDIGIPIILAGGLHPGNVADAIAQVRPYAVDVSSGVEESKGIKDKQKIKAFVNAVKAGDKVYEVD